MPRRINVCLCTFLDTDTLCLILQKVTHLSSFTALQQTCHQMNTLGQNVYPIVMCLEDIMGQSLDIHARTTLVKHMRIIMHAHRMTWMCGQFVEQFQLTKCTHTDGVFVPTRYDMALMCQYLHEFRVCAKHWFLGRVVTKLIHDFQHEMLKRRSCHDMAHNVLVYTVYQAYTWRSVAPNRDTVQLLTNAIMDTAKTTTEGTRIVHMVGCLLNNWLIENVCGSPPPLLDPSTSIAFTSMDVCSIKRLICVTLLFTQGFRTCMNQSSLYKWKNYRRDVVFGKNRLRLIEQITTAFTV
jgi:hypothetical protein